MEVGITGKMSHMNAQPPGIRGMSDYPPTYKRVDFKPLSAILLLLRPFVIL
jgi:hypothetical protein